MSEAVIEKNDTRGNFEKEVHERRVDEGSERAQERQEARMEGKERGYADLRSSGVRDLLSLMTQLLMVYNNLVCRLTEIDPDSSSWLVSRMSLIISSISTWWIRRNSYPSHFPPCSTSITASLTSGSTGAFIVASVSFIPSTTHTTSLIARMSR